jgi:hypothetical protein
MLQAFLLVGVMAVTPMPIGNVQFSEKVTVEHGLITLGQVADLSELPSDIRQRAKDLPLISFASTNRELILEHSRLASRARSLMPALSPWLRDDVTGRSIAISVAARNAALNADCGSGIDGVAHGDTVVISIKAGPFMVERQTRALQSAKPGQKFFVRTIDDSVLTARCVGAN